MNQPVDLDRRRWNAAMRLAIALSVVAAVAAIVASVALDVPQAVIVLAVIVVAYSTSWVVTGRVPRDRPAAARAVTDAELTAA
jgi:ABC-type Mn2+/Zn2+ transport system permease subunit